MVLGCASTGKYRGLCGTHYQQARRDGILDEVAAPRRSTRQEVVITDEVRARVQGTLDRVLAETAHTCPGEVAPALRGGGPAECSCRRLRNT